MGNIYKLTGLLKLLLLLSAIAAKAQTISPNKQAPYCPNEEVIYEAFCSESGTFEWEVTNGAIVSGANSCRLTVSWNNTPNTGSIKLTVKDRKDSNNKDLPNLYATTLNNIKIKSVNGYTPQPIKVFKGSVEQPVTSVNGSRTLKLDWCESSTYTFLSQRENFPNTNVPIDYYLWELPSGWTVADSRATPIGGNRYETVYEDLKAVPAKGDGGSTVNQVKVQAYSKNCNIFYNNASPYSSAFAS